jgi:hypothetical protein
MDSEHDSDAVPSVRKLKRASKVRALSEQVKEVEYIRFALLFCMSSSLVASGALMILVTVITKKITGRRSTKVPSRAVDSFCHWG